VGLVQIVHITARTTDAWEQTKHMNRFFTFYYIKSGNAKAFPSCMLD
jgi:hypothetical protein